VSIIVSNSNKQNLFAVFAVLISAACWGIIWYPYRILAGFGVTGIASSFYSYGLALLIGAVIFSKHSTQIFSLPKRAFWLSLIAGCTNLSYVMAVLNGEIMRVVLLFFLSPLWTMLLAHFLLKERIHKQGFIAIVLAMSGAMIMLNDFTHLSWPLPRNSAEWLALCAGVGFSMSNIFTRHASYLSLAAKSMLVWLGVIAVALVLSLIMHKPIPPASEFSAYTWWILLATAALLVLSTIMVQYGVTKITAIRSSVLFLFELIIAAIASYFLANEAMTWNEWLGGVLIVSAGLMSAMQDHN
jgi:drug/metabolite transporter (DMT)-like permease